MPVIDARYAMADLPAALDHLEQGPFGKVVIDLEAGAADAENVVGSEA